MSTCLLIASTITGQHALIYFDRCSRRLPRQRVASHRTRAVRWMALKMLAPNCSAAFRPADIRSGNKGPSDNCPPPTKGCRVV